MGLSSKQVSSDRNGWNQALLQASGTLEFPKPSSMKRQPQQQQPQQPEPLKCPRCDSSNTKFCYYNNYNKSQPRHFCKACKRHWTKGGTLRNVPVGGGRKNKRLKTLKAASKTSSTTATTTSTATAGTYSNMAVQAQQQARVSFPPVLGALEDKNFSEAYYKSLLIKQPSSSSLPESSITFNNKGLNDGIFMGSSTTTLGLFHQHDHYDLQFPYLSLGSFESNNNNNNNPCSISSTITSVQSPHAYNFIGDHETVINNSSSTSDHHLHHHQPWTSMATTIAATTTTTTSNMMDMPSNWGNWDDFDLTMPWDDADMKP